MHTVPRLYDTFQPDSYQLDIELDRAARTFRGTVSIAGVHSGSGPLTLHASDLEILSVTSDDTPVADLSHHDDLLVLDSVTKAGPRRIAIEFAGVITDTMHGLYPCYFEVDGQKKELLATQFESHHAREVFPCIDEPEAKAVFDLTLKTESGVTVLSNMPALSVAEADGNQTTVFDTTPRMSTYLLAFVIGELHKQSAVTKSGVDVSVWATQAQSTASLAFPLEVAIKTIDFFDEYFGTPYPLPKADHVALPDFSSGAMENWGLITYREVALLVDDQTSVSMREYVATVIAHETSHQWFGNLVTMKWWDDLWLNESFATIMEYVAVDALYPEWQTWNTFASQETLSALRRDQLAGVQAVRSEVNHPDEISTLFDPSIVYAKGGRLLKMLMSYIGEDAFRDGLKSYFKTHAYQNTVGADLWKAFSDSSGKDIEGFMDTWLSQPGFPLINVTTSDDGYFLSQRRFVIGAQSDDSLWPIPLFSSHRDFPELMETQELSVTASKDLPLLNVRNDAHFVTRYDEPSWQSVLTALGSNQLNPVARLALLHETSLLARGGVTETSVLIPLLQNYAAETSEPVWNIVSMVIADLKRFVEEDETSETHLKKRVVVLALPLFEKLGFDQHPDEAEQDTKLRATILSLLSYGDDEAVINRCLAAFRAESDLLKLPGEIRGIILSVAAKHGTREDFDRLVDSHRATANAELRDDLAAALCSTRDSSQITQLLDRLDTDEVKQQDVFRWYIYLLRNRHARQLAWDWMVGHWGWIEKSFKGDKSYDDFPRYSASVLGSRTWLETYRAFFEPMRAETALKRAIEVGETEIESRVEWLERDRNSVRTKLAQETA